MKQPNGDLNQLLRTLDAGARFTINDVRAVQMPSESVLSDQDEQYLSGLLRMLRAGNAAIVIVETDDRDKLKYIFSSTTRVSAMRMMGRIIDFSGRRMEQGE